MEQRGYTVAITINSEKLKLCGLKEEVEIDISGDIDFTELVSQLTELLDTEKIITFTSQNISEDRKVKLVIDTITKIISAYNSCLGAENVPIDNNGDAEVDELDDLPF